LIISAGLCKNFTKKTFLNHAKTALYLLPDRACPQGSVAGYDFSLFIFPADFHTMFGLGYPKEIHCPENE